MNFKNIIIVLLTLGVLGFAGDYARGEYMFHNYLKEKGCVLNREIGKRIGIDFPNGNNPGVKFSKIYACEAGFTLLD